MNAVCKTVEDPSSLTSLIGSMGDRTSNNCCESCIEISRSGFLQGGLKIGNRATTFHAKKDTRFLEECERLVRKLDVFQVQINEQFGSMDPRPNSDAEIKHEILRRLRNAIVSANDESGGVNSYYHPRLDEEEYRDISTTDLEFSFHTIAAENPQQDFDFAALPDPEQVTRAIAHFCSAVSHAGMAYWNANKRTVIDEIRNGIQLLEPEIANAIMVPIDEERSSRQIRQIDAENVARNRIAELMDRVDELPDLIDADLDMAYRNDPSVSRIAEIGLAFRGLKAVTVQRIAHRLYQLSVPFVPRMMTEIVAGKFGIDIHPGARIGRAFFVDHCLGTVIGETCVIGDNVTLYHGVTLGAKKFLYDDSGGIVRGNRRHPTIMDDAVIYSNTKVYGGETVIGKATILGADLEISHSIENGMIVTRSADGSIRIRKRDLSEQSGQDEQIGGFGNEPPSDPEEWGLQT